MATKKKLLQAAAGNAGGAGLDVDEVFSTYLYDGNGSTQTITNGIDLAGEGGLVWVKKRVASASHGLYDTERGASKFLISENTNAQATYSGVSSFLSTGFGLGSGNEFNQSGQTFASWTFLKSKRFFDIQTWTGNSTAGRTISHNLEAEIGFIAIKCTSASGDWMSWHRSASPYAGRVLKLNATDAAANISSIFNSTNPTSTEFTLGSSYDVNGNGQTYVAYIFAHNDGDGDFGPDGNSDIIKCGSYTGSGGDNNFIDIGFEPQWLLTKRANSSGAWNLVDNMRAFTSRPTLGSGVGSYSLRLSANTAGAESTYWQQHVDASGFRLDSANGDSNASGGKYIYIAIRRGSLAPPESATDVFDISHAITTNDAPFPVDFMLSKILAGANGYARDRLRGGTKYLLPDTTNADLSGGDVGFDDMTGTKSSSWGTSFIHYNWKRAPSYMDCVAYNGDATSSPNSRNINHNLGVAPEMMWIKCRTAAENWAVYHSVTGATKYLNLNNSAAAATSANWWRNTTPTDTVFTIGHQDDVNLNGGTHISYLFASLDGISRVGSYTGNGSFQTIDCGFSAGSRFVLIKRTDATGDWYVWDSERGITQAADPYLELNTTAAETTGNKNYLYPANSGFGVQEINGTNNPNINVSGATYIFYAIA